MEQHLVTLLHVTPNQLQDIRFAIALLPNRNVLLGIGVLVFWTVFFTITFYHHKHSSNA
jgi:hypothetical protein